MSASRSVILVTGATGKQGGAVIENLLAAPDAGGFHIIGVTRDASSARARQLASLPHVTVVDGDLAQPDAIFAKVAGPVWGVYSVQVNSDDEEQQGKAMVDAAVAHGVRHFVSSSGDRGGPYKSPFNPTSVKNFASKHRIEKHLEARALAAAPQPMTWTILRPVTFFENLTADVHGRGFARMWEQMGDGEGGKKALQFVSTRDIGWFAAASFLDPEAYRNAALTLAGDELTQPQADALFRKAVGVPMPLAPCPIASAVKFFLKGTVGDMFRWFEHEGYGGDVALCRNMYPQMSDFGMWIEQNKGQWAK